jgi:hypothetical protein
LSTNASSIGLRRHLQRVFVEIDVDNEGLRVALSTRNGFADAFGLGIVDNDFGVVRKVG